MPEHLLQKARAAARKFRVAGEITRCEIYGNGHIHDTFWVVAGGRGEARRYIMQRVNDHVFTKPMEVMENIAAITDYLRKELKARGPAPDMREVLRLAGLTGGKAAKVLGLGPKGDRTIRRWVGEDTPIPYAAWALLCDYAGLGLIWKEV